MNAQSQEEKDEADYLRETWKRWPDLPWSEPQPQMELPFPDKKRPQSERQPK